MSHTVDEPARVEAAEPEVPAEAAPAPPEGAREQDAGAPEDLPGGATPSREEETGEDAGEAPARTRRGPLDPAEDPERARFEKLRARAASFSDARVRTLCESLLLVADRPLTVKDVEAATGVAPARIRAAMEALAADYREGVSGIVLQEVAGGYQLRTCPTNSEFVRRFLQVRPARLTRAALETLAIVAYRQPVTRPEIEEIRGVDSGAVLKALLDKGLVQVLGKKEEPGRPLLYGTTRAFLEFFGLKDLASLPTLREYHELTEEHREIVEAHDAESGGDAKASTFVRDLMGDGRLDEAREADEAVLQDLEAALEEVESRARAAEEALGSGPAPASAPEDPPSGGAPPEPTESGT